MVTSRNIVIHRHFRYHCTIEPLVLLSLFICESIEFPSSAVSLALDGKAISISNVYDSLVVQQSCEDNWVLSPLFTCSPLEKSIFFHVFSQISVNPPPQNQLNDWNVEPLQITILTLSSISRRCKINLIGWIKQRTRRSGKLSRVSVFLVFRM